jgi:hypothetical protein
MYKWKYKALYSEEATYPKQSKRNGLKDTISKQNILVKLNLILLKLKYAIDNNRLRSMITLQLEELLMELLLFLVIYEFLAMYV